MATRPWKLVGGGLLLMLSALSLVSAASSTTETVSTSTVSTTSATLSSLTTSATTSPDVTTTSASTTPAIGCNVTPCENNGTCNSTNGLCECTVDFTGTLCDLPLDCPSDYCDATGTFNCTVVSPVSFNCNCYSNATGINCSDANICYNNPCQHNGTCMTSSSGYTCDCITGSLQPKENCSLNEQKECVMYPPHILAQHITCIDTIVGYHPVCRVGYEGQGCKDQITLANQCDRYNAACIDEGFCKPACDVPECNATSNCNFTVAPTFNDSTCESSFANAVPEQKCDNEENLYDGFDRFLYNYTDCSPYFWTACMLKYSNNICDPSCDTVDCMHDGGDCLTTDHQAYSHPNNYYMNGSVVIDFKEMPSSEMKTKTKVKLSLLTRTRLLVQWKDKPASCELIVPSGGYFTSIDTFGQFVSAALAKLPCFDDGCVTPGVTNIFVCEKGYYVDDNRTGCMTPCSVNCKHPSRMVGGTCESTSGHCKANCKSGFSGERCEMQCIPDCDMCYDNSSCFVCKKGTYLNSTKCHPCHEGCNDTCQQFDGTCSCKHGYYGSRCQDKCTNCADNMCTVNGVCITGCNPGWSNMMCDRRCPNNCKTCNQTTKDCMGDCQQGFKGSNCKEAIAHRADKDGGGNNTGVILAIVISLIIIALVLLVFCCYWRRRQSGDYIMKENEDFGVDKATHKPTEPASPLVVAESHDMIDMDDTRTAIAIYAGPDAAEKDTEEPLPSEEDVLIIQPDVTIEPSTQPTGSLPSVRMIDETDDEAETGTRDTGKSDEEDADVVTEPPKSPIEPQSPKDPLARRTSFKTQVSITLQQDGTMDFQTTTDIDDPPKSPLSQTLAPLASEEDLLKDIGPPKVPDTSPPGSVVQNNDNESHKSRSRSSSSSSSSSSDKEKEKEK